ncbi:unnamed protein product [Closterium sp. NIES-53]
MVFGVVGRAGWQWWQGGRKRFESVEKFFLTRLKPFELLSGTHSPAHPHAHPYHARDLRLDPRASAHWLRPAGDFLDYLLLRSDATVRPPALAAGAFAVTAVDQGHTAESVHAPPPAPAAAAAVAPPAPPATVAASSSPVPLAPAPPPSLPLPHGVPVSGASAPVALQTLVVLRTLVAPPPVQAAVGGPAQGTAVGASPDSAHLVAPAAAPVQPVAQRHAESQSHGAAGGNAAAHWGRGSPRRRPSSSYRSAHRGGRGGWWGGHGRGRSGPSEMQQLREDFPGMLAAAMRAALTGASNLESSLAPAAAAHAPAPLHARALPAPHAALAPNAQAYSQVHAPAVDRAPPASTHPISAAPYPPLPWIPPVPSTGFVGAGGGEARGAFVPPRRIADVPSVPPPPALPVPAAAQSTGLAQVPTATLSQLWGLVECQ